MAGTIQGLTVIINGDATSLSKAMREARAEASILRGHMKALKELVKLDPTNLSLIARQQMLMNAQMAQGATRLRMLRQAEQEFYASVGPHSEAEIRQFERLQSEITKTELAMANLRREAIEMGLGANASTLAWAGRLEKANAAISKVSMGFTVAGIAAAAFGALALHSAYSFESSFAGVRKTIIATSDEYEELARATRDIALTKPISVEDVNEIMMYAGQLNIATEYLSKFAGVMADLDVATDMDLEDGSMQLARFMNICNTAQGDVDRLGATIVDLGNNSATTESQIMLMAMRIAGTASNVGFTEQNILALAASLSATGIQAEMGGNAIATIIRRIDKDVDKGTESLQTWANVAGMTASEFASSWKTDVAGTFQQVISGMGRFQDEGGSLNLMLDDLHISYMRQVDVMQRLSRSGDMMSALIARADTAWANNSALVREATQRYDTAASKTKMMLNAFNELGIALGNEVLPEFKDVVLAITGAVQAFAKMDSGTKSTIINIFAAATAAGVLVNVLKLMTGTGATVIRFFASMKTALGLASMEQLTYTNMTIANTAALTGNTAALEANNLVKVQSMTFTEALSGATAKFTEKLTTMAASLGMSTAAFGGLVAGIAAGAIVIGLLVANMIKCADSTDALTASSRKAQQEAVNAEANYKLLAETEGETSDAALMAKASIEQETDAFKSSKETVGEYCDRMNDVVEAHERTKDSMRETATNAETEAGAMLLTMQRIKDLADVQDKDVKQKAEIAGLVYSLNDGVSGLNLVYDANTDTLKSNVDAWEALVKARADEARDTAYMENFNSTLAEQADLEVALAEAEAEWHAASEAWAARGYANFSMEQDAYNKTRKAYTDLSDAYKENQAQQQMWLQKMSESQQKTAAINEALALVNNELYTEQDAIDAVNESMGTSITLDDLHNQQLAVEAELAAETAEEVSKLAETIAKLSGEYPILTNLMNDSGITIEDFAKQLQEAGISADDLAKGVQDMAGKVQDGLNAIEVDSEMSMSQFMENLQNNIDVTNAWAENTRIAYEKGGEGAQDFIGYIHSLGPEHANLMAELANSSEEELQAYADKWREAGNSGADGFISGLEPAVENAKKMVEEASQAISNSNAPEKAKELADNILNNLRVPDTSNIGESAVNGIISGMRSAQVEAYITAANIASNIASTMNAALKINSPSKVTMRTGEGVGEGLILGMMNEVSGVNRASRALAMASVPDVSNATASAMQVASALYPQPAFATAFGGSQGGDKYEINLNLAYDASDDAADLARGVARKLGAIMDMRG